MAVEGNGFPWHFDTNNFTVTLAIQNADGGGAFEYAPGIRKGSENFSEVCRVLDGTSDLINVLELEPGDLQLFRGRHSLHRVTPLIGTTPRYVAIFLMLNSPTWLAALNAQNNFMDVHCPFIGNVPGTARMPTLISVI